MFLVPGIRETINKVTQTARRRSLGGKRSYSEEKWSSSWWGLWWMGEELGLGLKDKKRKIGSFITHNTHWEPLWVGLGRTDERKEIKLEVLLGPVPLRPPPRGPAEARL